MSGLTEKYPLPWSFEVTDRDGGGVLKAANGQLLMRWCADDDWVENLDDPHEGPFTDDELKQWPVINDEKVGSELIEFILAKINGE